MGVRLFTPRAAAAEGPIVRIRRDASALLLVVLAAYLALALASLDLERPPETNWMGPVGAGLAQVLATTFGLVAWLVPLELSLMAVPLLRRRPFGPLGVRLAGDLMVAIITASLTQVAFPESRYLTFLPAGGNVGLFFGEIMRGLFSAPGSFLIGATAITLILIARSAFSFIDWCERVSALARRAHQLSLALVRRVWLWLCTRPRVARWLAASRVARWLGLSPATTEGDDGRGVWQQDERTGIAPEAVARAIKDGLGLPAAPRVPQIALREDEEDSDEPTPIEAAEVESAPAPRASMPVPQRAPRGAAQGPMIVDTRPQSEIVRAKPRKENDEEEGTYTPPSSELLQSTPAAVVPVDRERVLELAQRLEATLLDYGVTGKVEEIHPGPTVTTYEVTVGAGTKVSKVAALSDDLALGLSRKVRIIAPIPGKSRIGFEIPNDERSPVNMRELVEDERFDKLARRVPLPVVMGRDIVGAPYYADLSSMPHVIVAGATGAGKSVGLNVMLCSLLFCRTPDELRMLMIDPKVVELAPFDGIPHMLLPVVTDMKQAATALKWAVNEMERRYQAFASAGTKNITTYNRWVERVQAGELPPPEPEGEALSPAGNVVVANADGTNLPGKLPYIVIVVDEFADLMMQQGKEVEAAVARLAQKARAAGMHVVLATQRPSVDVITGMIKANFPTRVGFRVAQKVDSRTILDEQGAELLLGKGDMLVKMNGSNETLRVQCPFISEEEVSAITDHLRSQGTPEYHDDILKASDEDGDDKPTSDEPLDPRFDEAVRIVAETQRCSTSWLQRKLGIGYNRAAKIVEMMELQGMVGPPNGSKEREVCIHPQ
jgi:DNA segregation ATPase FtsK/SpoIIIE, S-DNA-T family